MTNLYVSGYNNLSTYSTITSSNTLINADKIEKSFIKIYSNLYLDENHNLYSDINGNNLIDTNVTDIRPGTYLKDNKIYRVSDGFIMADQVKEYLLGDENDVYSLNYNDVNDKTHYMYYENTTSTSPSTNIIRAKKYKAASYALKYIYVDDNNDLFVGSTSPSYDIPLTSSPIDRNIKALITGPNLLSGGSYYRLYYITGEGKINRLDVPSYGNASIGANAISLDEDEFVETFLPIEEPLRASSISYYLFKTNKRVLTNNNYFKGVDPSYITHIFNNSTSSSSTGPFLACTTLIEYPVNIYKADNVTIDATINTLPITETYLIVDGTTATLTITDALGNSKNVVFQIEKRKGYEFTGLSTIKNDMIPQISIGTTTFNWEGELTLYQVYQKALPPDAVQATLYFNSAEPNRINKRNFLTKYKDIVGVFRSSVSIEDPVLVLELDEFPSFNYVYIKNFNRYYFVTGRDNISKNIYSLSLHIDPLYSFMDEISLQYADILRTSLNSLQNAYLNDPEQPIKNNKIIEIIESDVEAFDYNTSTGQYWLDAYRYIVTVNRGISLKAISDVLE